MKYILFLAFIILVSCQKDQLAPTENKLEEKAVVWDGTERKPTVTDETGERIGAFYPLYYKESVTTDNWTTLDTYTSGSI
jgi:hypothetical protein